jgi:acetoin utilization protein AcuC
LEVWHDPEYVAAVQRAEGEGRVSDDVRARYHLGTHANPVFPEMYRRPATAAGASILAGELLKDGGIVHSPAGGTHHGMPARANGFCYFNDPVLAVLSLRANGVRRVAYVDIDAHHADGVEFAFAGDPDVVMVSVHEEKRWPFTGALEDRGAGQVFNLPVPRGFNDTEMAAALGEVILPAVEKFRPDAVILQCGADAVEEDPLSRLGLSNNAHFAVVRALMPLAPRLLVLGGGGYNPWSVGRLWTGVWGVLNGREMPERLSGEAEAVLRGLVWPGRAAGKSPPEHWFTTLSDAPREGPVRDDVRARIDALAARLGAWV